MRGRRVGRRGWLGLLGAVALLSGCAGARPPNVLVVVLDTFRTDRMGAYGSTRGLTPFLDELAARGVLFERAYAASSWTSPSIASLLTSRHPLQHGITSFESVLDAGELTLAEILRPRGYATAGFSANVRLVEELGWDQGFETWRVLVGPHFDDVKARAHHLRSRVLSWLDGAGDPGRRPPVLLYVHYVDTHSPYDPPEPLRERFAPEVSAELAGALNERLHDFRRLGKRGRFSRRELAALEGLYDAEVAGLDAELRLLFGDLEARGFFENALVVVVADHGEEFGEHGEFLHGSTLHEPAVRVPLLLVGPGIEPGRRVAEPVSLMDVAPTVLSLLELPVPASFEGRPLLAVEGRPLGAEAKAAPAAAPPDVLLELAPEETLTARRLHYLGLVRGARKMLVDPEGRILIYDLASDPGEHVPESVPRGNLDLVAGLTETRERLAEKAGPPGLRVDVDDEIRDGLRALGYVVDDEAGEAIP